LKFKVVFYVTVFQCQKILIAIKNESKKLSYNNC